MTATDIPAEWRDPGHVMPHLSRELRGWLTTLRSIEQDLAIIRVQLDPGQPPCEHLDVLYQATCVLHERLRDVCHAIGSRTQAYVLISDELLREGDR